MSNMMLFERVKGVPTTPETNVIYFVKPLGGSSYKFYTGDNNAGLNQFKKYIALTNVNVYNITDTSFSVSVNLFSTYGMPIDSTFMINALCTGPGSINVIMPMGNVLLTGNVDYSTSIVGLLPSSDYTLSFNIIDSNQNVVYSTPPQIVTTMMPAGVGDYMLTLSGTDLSSANVYFRNVDISAGTAIALTDNSSVNTNPIASPGGQFGQLNIVASIIPNTGNVNNCIYNNTAFSTDLAGIKVGDGLGFLAKANNVTRLYQNSVASITTKTSNISVPSNQNLNMIGCYGPLNNQFVNETPNSLVGVNTAFPIVTSSRVYLLGGGDMPMPHDNLINMGATTTTSVLYADINGRGDIASWVTEQSNILPTPNNNFIVVKTINRIYTIGGDDASVIMTAPINPDGTLGAITTTALDILSIYNANVQTTVGLTTFSSLYGARYAIVGNQLYIFGGVVYSSVDFVYTESNLILVSTINTDGTLTPFTLYGNKLITAVSYPNVVCTPTKIYLLYGYVSGNNATVVTDVQSMTINNDNTLGLCVIENDNFTNTVTTPVFGASVTVRNKDVMLISGLDSNGATTTDSIYFTIDANGNLTNPVTTPTNVYNMLNIGGAMLKNKYYIFGNLVAGTYGR